MSSLEGSRNGSAKEEKQMKKEFGHNIVFKYESDFGVGSPGSWSSSGHRDDDSYVKSKLVSKDYDSLSDGDSGDESNGESSIVMRTILDGIQQPKPSRPAKKAPVQASSNVSVSSSAMIGREWLKDKCKGCVTEGIIGLPWQDLYSAVFEVLSSSGDNTVIQNDVRLSLAHTCTHTHEEPFDLAFVFSLQNYWGSLSLTLSKTC